MREKIRKFTKKIEPQQMYVYFFEAAAVEQGVAGKKQQQQQQKKAGDSEDRIGRQGFLRLCRRYLRIPESEISNDDLGRVFSYVDNFDRVPQQITGGQWVQFLHDGCVQACEHACVLSCVARVRAELVRVVAAVHKKRVAAALLVYCWVAVNV